MSIFLLINPIITIKILYFTEFQQKDSAIKYIKISLIGTIINLFFILILKHFHNWNNINFQFLYFLGDLAILGLDSISLWLILLVNLIIPIVILNSWKDIKYEREDSKNSAKTIKNFLILVLFVNLGSITVFLVLDILFFYISFEMVLIPMYFLIGIYGSRNKKIESAQNMLFLYTLFGSLF
jgi:NADH-ubiquinone oxidoreductase chain 4